MRGDQVESLATAALEASFDHSTLRELAGRSTSAEDLANLVSAFRDLGVALPSRIEAARELAQTISSEIVAGRVEPIAGASDLAFISREIGPGFHELDPFIYAWSEAESRPDDREFFQKATIDEAVRWVQTGRGSIEPVV